MSEVVSPLNISASLGEFWFPRIIAEVDDAYIKVAKIKGELAWHTHESEDEMFMVLKGHMRIELKDKVVELNTGDIFVVPKGVAHNPVAPDECHILLVERKSTLHTGDVNTTKTRSLLEQLDTSAHR